MTTPRHRPTALFVADADSSLKWAVTRLLEARDRWDCEILVVESAVTPSAAQVDAAVAGRVDPPARIGLTELARRVGPDAADAPDVLVLACRGDLIALLLEDELRGTCRAGVIVAGIPGVWLPPTELGLTLRRGVDLMVVHSHVERDAVERELPRGDLRATGLASLAIEGADAPSDGARSVVFAPQALVPASRADRARLLAALVDLARARPDLTVVIKVRGTPGEAQTHRDDLPYEALLAEVADVPVNLTVATGPMADHLPGAIGFVTVSSTAALEAVAAGVPTLCLADFGVGEETLTTAFLGSGLLGSLDDLRAGGFKRPDPEWMARGYLHPGADDDWIERVEELGTSRHRRESGTRSRASLAVRLRRRRVALGPADPTPLRHASTAIDAWRRARRGLPPAGAGREG
ncbi:hypothetical protein QQX09_04700 [Demequina sp. SYSU T00192]|uniref:Uncharacterized protein n=1 Tax=Demequina litoralis TaxID=3051660 RepID=A0ABT8G7N1_9MICO|nr:DUF6716 putative glycosyltransferase [Demequina sp. SYSU T00192]MDN4475157.1 hypothetical protein [Demequina sp. SYSU T00192]